MIVARMDESPGRGALPDALWPMSRHDAQGSARSPEASPGSGTAPSVLWRVRSGALAFFAPVVGASGSIYAVGADEHLYAVSSTGAVRWRARIGNTSASLLAVSADDTINVAGHERDVHLRALDSTGVKQWVIGDWTFAYWHKSDQGMPILSPDSRHLYVGSSDGMVHAVNGDGTEQWGFRARDDFGEPLEVAIAADGTVYCTGERLSALNPSGTLLWDTVLEGAPIGRPVVAPDGCIVIGSSDGVLYSFFPDGGMQWRVSVSPIAPAGSPAVDRDGRVYVALQDGTVCALSASGDRLWSARLDTPVAFGPVLGPEGTIYIGADHLYAISPAGTVTWLFSPGISVTGPPAVGPDGTVYVAADRLFAVSGDGQLQWTVDTMDSIPVDSALVIDGAETIYLAMDYHSVHAMARDGTLRWTTPIFVQTRNNPFPECGFDGPYRAAHNLLVLGRNNLCVLSDHITLISSDGQQLWSSTPRGEVRTAIASQGQRPIIFTVCWSPGMDENALTAWSLNGSELWTWTFPTDTYIWPVLAIGFDDTLYMLDGTGRAHALRPDDGTPLWSFAEDDVPFRELAVGNDGQIILLAHYGSHFVYSLDANGTLQWTFDTMEPVHGHAAIGADGTVHVINSHGRLFALNAMGVLRWTYDCNPRIHGRMNVHGPIIDGDGVIYQAIEHAIIAVDRDGTERWTFSTEAPICSGPVIGTGGRLYFGCYDGYLWAIGYDSEHDG
jgi:outer membrane protein assembly factor BamB